VTAAGPQPVAWLAGSAAALLQLAGALKTAPPLAGLPFDLTLASLALLLPALAWLAVTRRWRLDPALAPPLAAAALLLLWLVVAASWSASAEVAAAKLRDAVLLGPAMLAAGLLVGADPAARAALAAATLGIGALLAAAVAWGLAGGWALQAVLDPEVAKVNYQLAGLALAMAAGLAALHAAEARRLPAALPWLLLAGALALAALVPGGRMALLALGLGVALAPALRLGLEGRTVAAALWLGAGVAAGSALLAALLLDPARAEGLRTLERLTEGDGGLDTRLGLWGAALRWAGASLPLGLGTGGFPIAAGHGEARGLYPHNHALEALAETGLPGLVLWLGAFGGGVAVAARLLPRVAPARAARIAALVLPVALSTMVSSDLGNRMAWFALGLALSLGVACLPPHPAPVPRHV
jgi:O-antigen ligase